MESGDGGISRCVASTPSAYSRTPPPRPPPSGLAHLDAAVTTARFTVHPDPSPLEG